MIFYAIGLAGHATVEIVDRVYYALHDTWTPVKAASLAFVINLVLGLTLMQTPLNYGGLALGNSLAALAEATLLMVLVRRRIPGLELTPVLKSLGRTVAASLLMGITVATLPRLLQDRLALPATLELSLVVGLVVLAGGMVLFRVLISSTIGRAAGPAQVGACARLKVRGCPRRHVSCTSCSARRARDGRPMGLGRRHVLAECVGGEGPWPRHPSTPRDGQSRAGAPRPRRGARVNDPLSAGQSPLGNKRLKGRYRVGAVLGQGSLGMTYRAEDVLLQRPVAIKMLADRYADDPAFRERFMAATARRGRA